MKLRLPRFRPGRKTGGSPAPFPPTSRGAARTPLLCLDFGASSTKVAVASAFGRRARITEVVSIAPGTAALRKLVEERGWKGARVRVLVQEEHLFWRSTTVPKVSRRHLTSLLALESKKFAADMWDQYQWNYRPSDAGAPDGRHQAIAVGAATAVTIEDLRSRVVSAGLRIDRLVPFPEAARCLAPVSDGEEATAMLDLGADHCRVTIVHRGEAILYRQIGLGGRQLSEELQTVSIPGRAAMTFSPEAAEDLKRRHGIAPEPGSDASEDGVPLGQITAALRPLLEKLVRDLYSTFDYWNERYMGIPLGEVHLFGGTAALPGLSTWLESVLGLPVCAADPPVGSPADLPPAHLLAPGLALVPGGCLDVSAPSPPDDFDVWERRITWSRVAATLLLALGLGGGLGAFRLSREATRRAVWQGRLTGQEGKAGLLRHAEESEQREVRTRDIRQALIAGSPDWPAILAGISHRSIPDAPLTDLKIERATSIDGLTTTAVLRLSGRVTGYRPAAEVVADVLRSMSGVPGLAPASLVHTRENDAGDDVFDIQSTLKAGMLP